MRRRVFSLARLLAFLGAAAFCFPRAAMAQDQQIYTDSLAANWQNYSWCGTDFASTDYVHAGASSIKVSMTGGWQGFYLNCGSQSTAGYSKLTFWINGGAVSGRNLAITGLINGAVQASTTLNQFIVGGGVAPNAWKLVQVPLATLGLSSTMGGFWIQDISGGAQAPFYIDDVTLVNINQAPVPQVFAVDFKAGNHAINPLIYGTAFAGGPTITDLNTTLNRWGGNSTSPYNWLQNATNAGSDWCFESYGNSNASAGADADGFTLGTLNAGAQTMLTVPTIGWVAKLGANRSTLGSYAVSKYGAQSYADGNWGSGTLSSGQPITGNDPTDANMTADSAYQQNWIKHLTGQFNTAAHGGVTYYALDNEPGLWHQTHRDVHPVGATMDELKSKFIDYAAKIKAVDSGAQIVGPEEWGWTNYFYSGFDSQYATAHGWSYLPDRAAHNYMDMMPWLLDSLYKYDTANKTKSLDVFSLHYYPQGGEFSNDTSTAMQQRRNRSTRSLWDPNYTDETWVNAQVQMIPRMKSWVSTYYPGLKTAITEYNWGAESHINGATTLADVLGIFGREGLDMATYWTTPAAGTPAYSAIKMYRNVDGNNQAFGDVSVSDVVPDADNVSSFAAVRSVDGAQTIMVINKNLTSAFPVTINAANCNTTGKAQVWQLTSANVINRLPDLTLQTASGITTLQTTLPSQSITLFVIPAAPQVPVATTISGLYSTGLDNYGNPTADSAPDAHYTLVSTPGGSGGTPVVTQQHWPIINGAWLVDTAASKWISPAADESAYQDKAGDYTYQTTFTITGDPSKVSITGRVAGDDQIKAVILNGKTVVGTPFGGLNYWTTFTQSSGFVAGVNTVQFIVTNAGTGPNPTGFRCEMTGTVQGGGGGSVGSISGLFSTGLDSGRNPVADGSADAHYSLVSTPSGGSGTPFVTLQKWPIVGSLWLPDTGASKWLSPHADESVNLEAPGDYTYQTTFTVSGDPTTVSVSGHYVIDSALKAVILNGKTVLSGPAGSINYWSNLSLTSGFVTGTNTLQFVVTRTGSVSNPSGFRCELTAGH